MKAASLVVAAVLSSLHLIYYDLVLLGLPVAMLAVEGERTGFRPYEKTLLVIAWVLPMLCEFVAQYLRVPFTPLVGILLMISMMSRARPSWYLPQGKLTPRHDMYRGAAVELHR